MEAQEVDEEDKFAAIHVGAAAATIPEDLCRLMARGGRMVIPVGPQNGPQVRRPALPCNTLPCDALPCNALPCYALPCNALPCYALPCYALPCYALPCNALPCSAAV